MNKVLSIYSNGFLTGNNKSVFIIAEIGQNHQGCIETAKVLIETAKVTYTLQRHITIIA